MTKTLYLMRHGQTLFNELHKIQGVCDSPLTQKGIDDAKKVGTYFKQNNVNFDHAYSSTQERASDTLELVTDLPYQRVKGLKEWNFGLFEGESEKLNPKFDPKIGSLGDFFVQYGGEGADQVQQRMVKTLTNIMQQPDNENVFVVSHGGAIYLFLKNWIPLEEIVKHVELHNCSVLKFTFSDDVFNYEKTINVTE
ncbi:histidine phosphatase family protein [Companilactobacillus halodurans]|uniref:Histidine phosphatase family protein n=1 Tax=Companilactobacillus halodurans TaxID=2584183 RepID=A0A5P0ZYN0_9LACO|nr:histidine phosphatase family protein [Companilactobacillus halodurans]MQS98203.1 histidine phosphatase family protein [Companilactobacillus halodurans]